MKNHKVKCFTKQFQPIVDGIKRSDIRFDDRGYQIGDTITYQEGQPEIDGFSYTGREVSCRISYIDDFGCQIGYLNLSLSQVGLLFVECDEEPEFLKEQAL